MRYISFIRFDSMSVRRAKTFVRRYVGLPVVYGWDTNYPVGHICGIITDTHGYGYSILIGMDHANGLKEDSSMIIFKEYSSYYMYTRDALKAINIYRYTNPIKDILRRYFKCIPL